jgi:NAD(P)-dependent dehydrogenase (short-subunit alcohol dehydrogenase family)
MNSLAGKIILITGAGRGAGRALALALAARGARLAANDISPVNVETVVDEILAAGGQARVYLHDVAKKVDVQALINSLIDEYGRLDVLINCANVQPPAPLLDLDEWDLHRLFEVNAIGTLLMIQSAGRVMRAQGSGQILNVIKLPANAPAAFIASRAGLEAMSLRADAELRPYGVRVHAVTSDPPLEAVFHLLEAQP